MPGRKKKGHSSSPPEEPREDAEDERLLSEQVFPITLNETNRVVEVLTFDDRNQLVDFCIEQKTLYLGEWRSVIRYDCNHGMIHADIFSRSGSPPRKEKVADIEDMDRGWDIACGAILDTGKWEQNLWRWRNG